MLGFSSRALNLAAALVAACLLAPVSLAQAPAPAKPATATKKPASTSSKPKPKPKPGTPAAKKPAKPVPPAPPPPPPPVELIGLIVMPADAMRAGPPSGAFDGEGRRAAAPRFDAQPVQ